MSSSSERQSHKEEGNDRNGQVPGKEYSKRRHGSLKQSDFRVIRDILRGQRMKDVGLYLEPLLRTVVRQELPPILERHRHLFPSCEATPNQARTSGGRALRLCFTNRLSGSIFTRTKITCEDGAPLGIALCDAASQNCIVKEGPLSCTRIMMCALNGDFGSNGSEDWSEEEFNANITPERENKGPLLIGERFIKLENGVGFVTNIEFSDNSRWTRSGKFKLGAKAVQNEANIRECRSEAFAVKDKRGESYRKHERPSLNDDIWRLRKIAKGGPIHKRMLLHQVKTVKDLLQQHTVNAHSLQEKMGKIAKKSWDTIIEHAGACGVDDGKRYIYQYPTAGQPISLVFNSVHKLVEVSFDGQYYRILESLNSEEKRLVERAKQNAYENLKDLVPLETSTSTFGLVLQTSTLAGQPSTSTSLVGEVMHDEQVGTDQMPLNSPGGVLEFGVSIEEDGWHLNGSRIQCANYLCPPSPWGIGNPFGLPCGDGAEYSYHPSFPESAVVVSSSGKRKTVWKKIRNAFKWVIPFVAKRKGKLSIPCNY